MKKFSSAMLVLAFALALVGCSSEAKGPSFDGTYEASWGKAGFIFSGSNVTQYSSDPGNEWTNPGTFTYTDTTITFVTEWRTWAMGYTLTDTWLDLRRLPGDTDNWAGRFNKK